MSAFRLKRSSDVLNPGGVSSNGLGKAHRNSPEIPIVIAHCLTDCRIFRWDVQSSINESCSAVAGHESILVFVS